MYISIVDCYLDYGIMKETCSEKQFWIWVTLHSSNHYHVIFWTPIKRFNCKLNAMQRECTGRLCVCVRPYKARGVPAHIQTALLHVYELTLLVLLYLMTKRRLHAFYSLSRLIKHSSSMLRWHLVDLESVLLRFLVKGVMSLSDYLIFFNGNRHTNCGPNRSRC